MACRVFVSIYFLVFDSYRRALDRPVKPGGDE